MKSRNIIILFLMSLLVVSFANGQRSKKVTTSVQAPSSLKLYPLFRYGEWGYIDESGKFAIQPQFEFAEYFSEGLALVRVGGKWGYINESGAFVINPQFEDYYFNGRLNFHEGLAAVSGKLAQSDGSNKSGTAIGFIDKTGKFVIKPQFNEAYSFSDGLALVKVNCKDKFTTQNCGQWYINKAGRTVIKVAGPDWVTCNGTSYGTPGRFKEGLAMVRTKDCKVGFIDKTGRFAIKPQFDDAKYGFSEGLVGAAIGKKWGFIDKTGKFVINPQFEYVDKFSGGLASAGNVSWINGYIGRDGKFVIPPQFSYGYPFSNNNALVDVNEKKFLIDRTGKKQFDLASSESVVESGIGGELLPLTGGRIELRGWNMTGIGGYINRSGQYVVNPRFEEVGGFSEGLGQVRRDGKWGYMDSRANIVIKPQFEDAFSFSEGLARVVVNNKAGFIDKSGKFVINPTFEDVGSFSDGLAFVRVDRKYGFIGRDGKIAIPPEYDEVSPFSEGLALVRTGKKFGYVDRNGSVIVSPQFDQAFPFSEGLAGVKIEKKLGFIDKIGRFVIRPQFDNDDPHGMRDSYQMSIFKPSSFSEGLAAVKVDTLWGFIDKRGRFIISPDFTSARNFTGGVAWVSTPNGPVGRPIDKRGRYLSELGFIDSLFTSEGRTWIGTRGSWIMVTLDGSFDSWVKNEKGTKPTEYSVVRPFSEGLALVGVDGKWGYIDRDGKYVWHPTK